MKRILLATVATLPLLVLGMNPASSQDIKRHGNAGTSQSQESAHKESAHPQGKEVQGKSERAVKVSEGSGGAQGRKEQVKSETRKPEGRAMSGHEGSAVAAGRDQKKDHAQSVIKSESRKVESRKVEPKQVQTSTKERTASEKLKEEPKGGTKGKLSDSQTKAKKTDEKLTKGPQNEPARTTEQTTRSKESDRLKNGQTERHGGQASGRVTLNETQRTKIEKTVLSGRNVPRVERVNFSVDVGVVVPREVRFARVPEILIEINSEWRDDDYFVVRDEIVIIDRSRRIVALVPIGSSSATYVDAGDFDIRRVQEVLIEKGYYHGRVDGELGPDTRRALIRFQEREGIEARGVIDERTYVALGIRVGTGRSEGRIEGKTEERVQGRTEGRTLQSEEKGRLSHKPGQSELKRDQSSISGEAHGDSKSSESRRNAHAAGGNKASEPQGGTVGQATRKTPGAHENQRKHD